jgi:hypothetical protein
MKLGSIYSQQLDFWQGAASMKQPECIQDTWGLRIERQHGQKFNCEEYRMLFLVETA